MAISDYLNRLIELKNSLALKLETKGVEVNDTDKLGDLINKVDDISSTEIHTAEPFEKILYSFGVLSDIHVKNPSRDSNTTDTQADYIRALNFYKNNGADFVCVAGDIVWNGSLDVPELEESGQYWVEEVQLFKTLNDEYFNNAETGQIVYATTGNHDASLRGYTHGEYGLKEIATYYGDGTKTGLEAWEEIVGTPLNYVIEQGDDVFIFLGMAKWNRITFFQEGYTTWLETQLENYKDKRVFLFFHLFLEGTFDNLLTSQGMPSGYTTGSVSYLEPLINSYKNVIWFSGHSHIDLNCENIDTFENPNIYQNENSMTMVHVPACAYLRLLNSAGTSYVRTYGTSQGLWVDVYADKIVVKGIDFATENNGSFIPKANYVINSQL